MNEAKKMKAHRVKRGVDEGGQSLETYKKVPEKKAKGGSGEAKGSGSLKKKAPRKAGPAEPSLWMRVQTYLREVVYELRKVVWPSRKETIGSTSVVVIIVILCGIYLGFVDFLLAHFVKFLIG
ncbi:preprotein translocase subunit SecE [Desulfosoma caldarium]|uniref:Protein translocase subunit SecE n=1 Tax=Desulfosoma caldarium TaxID=610254 RepID=A0A3N1VP99_9BACT|nr:preprotein translocase subunit SecE [Desulfosoma caldarium]ROR01747.1 preprotein translocase subunit SecE [Desulfosoma caldarium]